MNLELHPNLIRSSQTGALDTLGATVLVTTSTENQRTTQSALPTSKEPPTPKENCLQLLEVSPSFGRLSRDLWTRLSIKTPGGLGTSDVIREEIQTFKDNENNEKHIEILNKKMWKQYIEEISRDLEKSPPDPQAIVKWKAVETFRTDFVELQNKLTGLAAQVTDVVHDSRDWGSFGTPGNKSDIDNVYSPQENTREEDQMLVKIFADTFYTHVMDPGSLSGIQLDVETYIAHPGKTQNTEAKITTTSQGKLYHIELTMAQLQMRKAYDHDHEGWENYKNSCLEFHQQDEKLTHSLDDIFTQVEQFHAEVQVDTLNEMIKQMPQVSLDVSQAQENVNKAFATGNAKVLGETIDALRDALRKAIELLGDEESPNSFEKAYKEAGMTYKCPHLLTLSQDMDVDHRLLSEPNLTPSEKDKIHLRLAKRGLLRNSFFDESYLTAGAYNVVCDKSGGQLSKREDENNVKLVEENRRLQTSHLGALSAISQKRRKPPTALDLVSSVSENSAQFHHIAFSQKKDLIKAAIDSSKYAERTTSSSLEVLKIMRKKDSKDPEIDNAFNDVEALHKITTALEKRKRQTELDDVTTQKLLEDILLDPQFCYTTEESKKIKENLNSVLKMFQSGGAYFNEEITLTDKYTILLRELDKRGCVPKKIKRIRTVHLGIDHLPQEIRSDQRPTSMIEPGINRLPKDVIEALHTMQPASLVTLFHRLDFDSQVNLVIIAERTAQICHGFASLEDIARYAAATLKGYQENQESGRPQAPFSKSFVKQLINADITELRKDRGKDKMQWENAFRLQKELPLMTSGNEKFDTILRARVGFPRIGDTQIQELHTLSKGSEMMGITGLNTPEKINKYFKDIEKIQHNIIKLTRKIQLLPLPAKDNEGEKGTKDEDVQDIVCLWKHTKASRLLDDD